MKSMKLEELAEVLVGQIMTRVSSKEEGEGEKVRVIIPGAVQVEYISEESLGTNYLIKKVDEKYYTKEGDLVMKLTSDYDVALIKKEEAGCVISSFVAVIRPKELDSKYLGAILNSTYIKDMLRAKAAGSTMSMIKVSDIRNLVIPIFEKDIQESLGKTFYYGNEDGRLQIEMGKLNIELTKKIIDNVVWEEIDNE